MSSEEAFQSHFQVEVRREALGCAAVAPASVHHCSVVFNFITNNSNPQRPLVALFRRSNEVHTYRGLLAPIFGCIDGHNEASPVAAAILKVANETGLQVGRHLSLHINGKPFKSQGGCAGKEWTFYSFEWPLHVPAKLYADAKTLDRGLPEFQLDWRHSEVRWVEPRDVLANRYGQESIPHLAETLRSVWLGEGGMFGISASPTSNRAFAGDVLNSCLERLRYDKMSGARKMASNALWYLLDVVEVIFQGLRGDKEETSMYLWKQVRLIVWHLIHNGRESMNAAISTALLTCLKTVEPFKNDYRAIIGGIKKYANTWESETQRIAEQFAAYIERHVQSTLDRKPLRYQREGPAIYGRSSPQRRCVRILTISYGSNLRGILAALLKCTGVNFEVRILESRPLCEGAILAARLIEGAKRDGTIDRLQVVVAVDASAASLAKDVDFVVIGADRISQDGDICNKIGSFPAILSAKAVAARNANASLQVVVLSGLEKVAAPASIDSYKEEENSPVEIFQGWGPRLGCTSTLWMQEHSWIVNKYFEWVYAEYIDVYISELGETTKEQIRERSHLMLRLEEEMFQQI